ncbi:reticulon-4 isoform 1-T1 [Rhinophrynus dorsalis]
MEDQSPFVSSSHSGYDEKKTPEEPHRFQDQPHQPPSQPDPEVKPWEGMDDVLDLTGGAGAFSHPSFKVSYPTRDPEEDEDDKPSWTDSLEPSPEEEKPVSLISDPPRAPAEPSAPEEEHEKPAVPCRAPSGSVDENLFPLPTASAPLMHSSADNVMDLQTLCSTVSVGQEELASLLSQSTSSLPSLSPLSADSAKEHALAVAISAELSTPEALEGPTDKNMYSVSRTNDDLPLVPEKLVVDMEPDYSSLIAGQKPASVLGQIKEEVILSEKGYVVEHPTSQQEVSDDHTKLYSQSAKEMFSGMLKSVGPPHEEFSDIKEGLEEHYVDFKPFVSTRPFVMNYEVKDEGATEKCQKDVGSVNLGSVIKAEEKYSEERDIDLSDDISPLTPEAAPDSSHYETFTSLEQRIPFTFGGIHVLENKTDERKMEDIETRTASLQFGSNVATVNPFFEQKLQEGDYVTTHGVSETSQTHVTNKVEGLTPDIVQEAYESEVQEVAVPKLGYESKIDLVQTAAESVQENVSPQTVAPFKEAESVSSPVLPDIVMEAPLTSSSVGLETIALQPDISPISISPIIHGEKLKTETEKPPSYEEAVNKETLQDQSCVSTFAEPTKGSPVEEPETPYISIACDLIKETIATESVAASFTDFPKDKKNDFSSQFEHFDESSPESEHSEPSYRHWEPESFSRDALNIRTENVKNITQENKHESDQKMREPSPSKSYLESFETELYTTKDCTDIVAEEPVTEMSKKQEKSPQTEMVGKSLHPEEVPSSKNLPVTDTAVFVRSPTNPVEDDYSFKAPGDDLSVTEAKEPEDQVLKNKSSLEKKENQGFEKMIDFSKTAHDAQSGVVITPKSGSLIEEIAAKPKPPPKEEELSIPSKNIEDPSVAANLPPSDFMTSAIDLIYWRDIKKSGVVFGASLFLLLSLTVFSIVSVTAYIALGLLSVTISFRIYKGVLQAIQKSDEGHPFRSILDSNVAVSEDLVQKYCNVALSHVNCTVKELRRLFLVEDLVDSLKFAVLMWVFTYIGALFNGLTLLILALISLFSIPVIYERHQTQVDHYLALINKNVKNTSEMILSKIPGLKRKAE